MPADRPARPLLSPMTDPSSPSSRSQHASKRFGAIARARRRLDRALSAGEVHALVGENGAGKSTLVKILAGVHLPDSGTLRVDGRERRAATARPRRATPASRSSTRSRSMFPDLTVAENIFIGRQPLRAGPPDRPRAMNADAAAIFERLGVPLDPGRIARGLSIAEQQIVEIAKALSLDAQGDRDGRADGGALGRRGRAAVRRRRDAARRRRRRPLHLAPARGGVRASASASRSSATGGLVMSRELAGLTADDLVRAMVGRELAGARRRRSRTSATPVLQRRAPDARGRLRRRLVRGARGRDRRARRARRRGPERGRLRDLRRSTGTTRAA